MRENQRAEGNIHLKQSQVQGVESSIYIKIQEDVTCTQFLRDYQLNGNILCRSDCLNYQRCLVLVWGKDDVEVGG